MLLGQQSEVDVGSMIISLSLKKSHVILLKAKGEQALVERLEGKLTRKGLSTVVN